MNSWIIRLYCIPNQWMLFSSVAFNLWKRDPTEIVLKPLLTDITQFVELLKYAELKVKDMFSLIIIMLTFSLKHFLISLHHHLHTDEFLLLMMEYLAYSRVRRNIQINRKGSFSQIEYFLSIEYIIYYLFEPINFFSLLNIHISDKYFLRRLGC